MDNVAQMINKWYNNEPLFTTDDLPSLDLRPFDSYLITLHYLIIVQPLIIVNMGFSIPEK